MSNGPTKITPSASDGGLSTLSDLYRLINGESTVTNGGTTIVSGGDITQTGGTTTKTESNSFSPEAMNAMLQSALEGNSGLASVASGQRTSGGYSSATNRLLVNDLLTRSVSQLGQLNQTKTTSTTTPTQVQITTPKVTSADPKTTTVGGVTGQGIVQTGGFLAGMQMLDKAGAGDWLKKNVFGGTATPAPAVNTEETSVAGNNYVANIGAGIGGIGKPGESAVGGVDVEQAIASTNPDQSNYTDYTPITSIAPIQEEPTDFAKLPESYFDFADGGLVGGHPMIHMADGGAVKKQLGSIIGSQSNIVIDPRKGLIGGAGGFNVDGTPISSSVVSNPQSSDSMISVGVTGDAGDAGNVAVGVGGSVYDNSNGTSYDSLSGFSSSGGITSKNISNIGQGLNIAGTFAGNKDLGKLGQSVSLAGAIPGMMDVAGRVIDGNATRADLGFSSNVLGKVANLTQDTGLKNLATAGNLATARTPEQLAMGVADVATKGALSKAKGIFDGVNKGSLSSTVNAVASFNPLAAAYNAVAGLMDVATIGEVMENAKERISPNQAMTKEQQASLVTAQSDNQAAIAAQEAASLAMTATPTDQTQPAPEQTTTQSVPLIPINVATGSVGGGSSRSDYQSGYGTGIGLNAGDAMGGFGTSSEQDTAQAANGGLISNLTEPGNNAGQVEGPGTTVSDSVHAKLSRDEYVLPADVVKMIGVDTLDALVKRHHVPAEVQKLRNFARA